MEVFSLSRGRFGEAVFEDEDAVVGFSFLSNVFETEILPAEAELGFLLPCVSCAAIKLRRVVRISSVEDMITVVHTMNRERVRRKLVQAQRLCAEYRTICTGFPAALQSLRGSLMFENQIELGG